jgi:hypothetical protein
MPWLSTYEIPNNRRGKVNYAAKREYERSWKVIMSSPADGSIQVSVAPGIPFMFSPYIDADGTFDLGAILYDLSAEQQPEMVEWIVTAKYASGERSRYSKFQPEKGDNRFNAQNPLDRPPQFIWGSSKYQKPVIIDQYGVNIACSHGDVFDPPPTVTVDYLTLTIVQNEAFYDPSVTQIYQNAINSDNFLGAPPFTVKLNDRSGRSNVENNFLYWEVSYQFEFRPFKLDARDVNTWNLSGLALQVGAVPPVGCVQYSPDLGWLLVKRNESAYGTVLLGNGKLWWYQRLDRDGRAINFPGNISLPDNQGQVSFLPPGSQPYYFVFHIYPEVPFNGLISASM